MFKDKSDGESLLGDVESVVDKRDDDVGSARTSVSLSTVSGSGKTKPIRENQVMKDMVQSQNGLSFQGCYFFAII